MSSSNVIQNKKAGRPRIGKKTAGVFAIRLPDEIKKAVDAWARREGIKSRSAAIRRLLERGLERE